LLTTSSAANTSLGRINVKGLLPIGVLFFSIAFSFTDCLLSSHSKTSRSADDDGDDEEEEDKGSTNTTSTCHPDEVLPRERKQHPLATTIPIKQTNTTTEQIVTVV